MYLAKYVAVALVFFAVLLYAIRKCRSTPLSAARGKLSRAVLSLLALALLYVVWYYSGDKSFDGINVKYTVRTVSVLLFVYALPDIWADGTAVCASAAETDAADAADGVSAPVKDETDKE